MYVNVLLFCAHYMLFCGSSHLSYGSKRNQIYIINYLKVLWKEINSIKVRRELVHGEPLRNSMAN